MGESWHTDDGGNPSALFTGGVRDILAPYIKAVSKGGHTFDIEKHIKRYDLNSKLKEVIEKSEVVVSPPALREEVSRQLEAALGSYRG